MTTATVEAKRRALWRAMAGSTSQGIQPRAQGVEVPATNGQQELWLFQQMHPESAAYNVPQAWELKGEVDVAGLKRAIETVVQKHEVLRTRYEQRGNGVVQIVEPRSALEFRELDFSPEAFRAREQAIETLVKESKRPFNLSCLPVVRVISAKVAPGHYIFFVNIPHIAIDGWSHRIFVADLEAAYRGEDCGNLTLQYADFALWKKQNPSKVSDDYWKKFDFPMLQLPTDQPARRTVGEAGKTLEFQIPGGLVQKLKGVKWGEGITLFSVMMAGFQTLLSRLSGQKEIVVGVPFAGRDRQEVENLIGYFIRTLPFQAEIAADQTFVRVVEETRARWLELHENSQTSWQGILEARKERGNNTLFNVMFVFQSESERKLNLPGIEAKNLFIDQECAKYDLTLSILESPREMLATIEYRTELFSTVAIERLFEQYMTLLEGAVTDPLAEVGALPILTEADKLQLRIWNSTKEEFADPKCLHLLVEDQARRTPDARVLTFGERHLTYKEFNERANQLAHKLKRVGIGRDDLVAVSMQRSLEMIVALLGVIKAGAGYVPVDPTYPEERVKFMLADCGAKMVLSHEPALAHIGGGEFPLMLLDDTFQALEGESKENPENQTNPGDIAYVIYTSGTTGLPKGAGNTHEGICNRLLWGQRHFPLSTSDQVPQKTPFSFDVSVWEIFGPLIAGSRLVITKPGGHRDPEYLIELIGKEKLTVIHFVPSMLQAFLNEPRARECRSLRRVVCSGEALTKELENRFFRVFDAELVNLYGPTEASVEVAWFQCEKDSRHACVPIGRPIANTQLHILDSRMQQVPIGVAGELHIGGIGVARGYHGRPELTREKFVADPFDSTGKGRLYKTGDLARYLADGNIEYLGRIDHQVKIRGFRIELGEIETVLLQHADVRECVVVADDDASGTKRLVAYLSPAAGRILLSSELRQFLNGKLPDYMCPALFVVLETLPLNANGKVDRKRLPKPGLESSPLEDYLPPNSPLEQQIARIWSEVLGVSRVGLSDNFFHLGGHSLFASQVISRIREQFQIEIPLLRIFERPTLGDLALSVDELRGTSMGVETAGIERVDDSSEMAGFSEDEVERMLAELTKGS
jgi:amino acid adenylation domain-containing protein